MLVDGFATCASLPAVSALAGSSGQQSSCATRYTSIADATLSSSPSPPLLLLLLLLLLLYSI